MMNPNEIIHAITRALAREQQLTAGLEEALAQANARIAELEAAPARASRKQP